LLTAFGSVYHSFPNVQRIGNRIYTATIFAPNMGNSLLFRLKVIGGALGFVVIAGLIYWRAKAKQKV